MKQNLPYMQQVILSNGGGAHEKKNGRQPTYKVNIGFYFFKTLFSKVACALWCSWTLAVNMKYTCFIFEYMEAGGIWLPLWALIAVVATRCSSWVLFTSLLFRPKRLTNGGQWCNHLLELVPKVFPSPTDHLWREEERKYWSSSHSHLPFSAIQHVFFS